MSGSASANMVSVAGMAREGTGTWAGRLDPTAAGPDPTMPITAAACEDADRFRLASLDYAPWESR